MVRIRCSLIRGQYYPSNWLMMSGRFGRPASSVNGRSRGALRSKCGGGGTVGETTLFHRREGSSCSLRLLAEISTPSCWLPGSLEKGSPRRPRTEHIRSQQLPNCLLRDTRYAVNMSWLGVQPLKRFPAPFCASPSCLPDDPNPEN